MRNMQFLSGEGVKTFEGTTDIKINSGVDDWRIIFPIYLLRAASVTIIICLLVYLTARLLGVVYPVPTFLEFIFGNFLVVLLLFIFLFLAQVLVYTYRSRKGKNSKRSMGEVILGYALPLIGIAAAVYTAYAIGAM